MLNEIVFPAAILQPPFFYPPTPEYPLGNPALSFGGIGAVIAHEIRYFNFNTSHGYDDQGRQYDHEGNLNDWWTPTDSENYLERTKLIIEQFDAYQLLGQHVNGKLTQGENIADLGGASVSYKAFMKYLQAHDLPPHKDYSQQQLFFINFARIWRNLARDEAAKQLLTVDPHSPGEFRANGTLSNLVEFYELFGVKEGDGMYRSGDKRVSIW